MARSVASAAAAAVALAVLLALLTLATPSASSAGKAKEKAVDTYCSPTGDYCTEVVRKKGSYFFKLVTFAHRGKARFCAQPKGRRKTCRRTKLRNDGDGVYLARINWNRKFPSKGSARRKVTVFAQGSRLGRALSFKP